MTDASRNLAQKILYEDMSDIDPQRSNDKIGDLLDRILNEKHRR
jgi:hypothetical protein